jgi:hypothetical protein
LLDGELFTAQAGAELGPEPGLPSKLLHVASIQQYCQGA